MSHLDYYDLGQRLLSRVTFLDENDVPGDPTSITFKWKDPDGNITTKIYGVGLDVVRESEGTYICRFTVNMPGKWAVRWEGTGEIEAPKEKIFMVKKSDVIPNP